MRFFHLNFLNVWDILAQGIYNARTMFRQFSDVKNGRRSQQSSVLSQLIAKELAVVELVALRKVNLIFQ